MKLSSDQLQKAVVQALGKSASRLDETVVDYLCSILAEGTLGDEEEAISVLGPFLEGELGESESTRFCKSIYALTHADATKKKEPELSQLAKPISLRTQLVEEASPDWAKEAEDKLVSVDLRKLEAVESKRQQRKQAKIDREERKKNSVNSSLAALKAMKMQQDMVVMHSDTANRNRDIKIENFTMSFGKDVLLTNATVTLAYGRRYGIVGRNGSGKSTLLRHIAARETGGMPALLSILHVEQEVVGDDTTALEAVLASDIERAKLLAEERRLTALPPDASGANAAKLAKIFARLEEIDAHSAESRGGSILAGLGFTPAMQQQATKDFSGGWRMRIALARALFCKPDVLILDEPTNHLDLFATLWLENYLLTWRGTLLIVSHQRDFLNTVATDIIHVFNKNLEVYRGNYDAFEDVRYERMRQQSAQAAANAIRRKHVQTFIDRFRYNAKRASLVQSRIKALEKMAVIEEVMDDPTLVIQFPDPNPLTPPILQFCDVAFGYSPDRILFSDLNIGIDLESRVALVGANGVGKSTLLKLLTGELQPSTGHVVRHNKLTMASFSQHFVDQLDLTISPLQTFQKAHGESVPVQTMRSHLGSFGLSGDLALRTINTLSGGQKCRLVFAIMAWKRPHVLLLDEPTNHLDMETIDSLAQALLVYKGGVLMVSHDERLISLACDQLWYFDGQGGVRAYDGDFKAYKKSLLQDDALSANA